MNLLLLFIIKKYLLPNRNNLFMAQLMPYEENIREIAGESRGAEYEDLVRKLSKVKLGGYAREIIGMAGSLYDRSPLSAKVFVEIVREAAKYGLFEKLAGSGELNGGIYWFLKKFPVETWRPTNYKYFVDTFLKVLKQYGPQGVSSMLNFMWEAIVVYDPQKTPTNPEKIIEIYREGVERREFLSTVEKKAREEIDKAVEPWWKEYLKSIGVKVEE